MSRHSAAPKAVAKVCVQPTPLISPPVTPRLLTKAAAIPRAPKDPTSTPTRVAPSPAAGCDENVQESEARNSRGSPQRFHQDASDRTEHTGRSPQAPLLGTGRSDSPDESVVSVSRGEPEACIFVASLCSDQSDCELCESLGHHFSKWGLLLSVKVFRDSFKRPYAFVQFQSAIDAQQARKEGQQSLVNGRPIRIEPARVNRTLYISKPKEAGGIAGKDLRHHLEAFGPIESITPHSEKAGEDRISRLVKFCYREDAVQALLTLRFQCRWTVDWASNMERRRVQIEKKCIFVGQLDPDMATHGNLERHFSVHGLVESIQIFSSTEHQARNKDKGRMNAWNRPAFAFIRFTDESSAESALRENGKQWGRFALKIQYRETSLSRMRAEHAEYQRHRRWESVQGDTSLTNGPHAHSEEPWSTALDAAPKDGEEEDEFYPSPNYSVTSHEPWPPGQPDMVSMYASEHALGFYDPAFVPAAASRYCGPPEWVKYPAFSTQAVYPVPTILPPVAYPPCYSYRLHPFYGLSIGRGDMAVGAASSQLVRTDSDRPRKTTIPFNYTPYVPSTYPEYI